MLNVINIYCMMYRVYMFKGVGVCIHVHFMLRLCMCALYVHVNGLIHVCVKHLGIISLKIVSVKKF